MSGQSAARQSPHIINPEFQRWTPTPQAQQKVEAVTIAFDTLLNEVKEALPDSRYLSLAKTHLEEACMEVTKGICAIKGNQE